jgi:hypothetical protein
MTAIATPAIVTMASIVSDGDHSFDFVFYDAGSPNTPHNFENDDKFALVLIGTATRNKITFATEEVPND